MLDYVGVEKDGLIKKGSETATTILCGNMSYSLNIGDRFFAALSDCEANHSPLSVGDF